MRPARAKLKKLRPKAGGRKMAKAGKPKTAAPAVPSPLMVPLSRAVALLFSDHPRHKDSEEHTELLAAMRAQGIETEAADIPSETDDEGEEADEGAGAEHKAGM